MQIAISAIDLCHRLLYHPPLADYRDWTEKFTLLRQKALWLA